MQNNTTGLALEINDLVKIYNPGGRRETKALDGVSLNVRQGDFFGLLGPNGAGKSTLIGCLSTTVLKTSGTIKINGFDLESQGFAAKKSIGVVPQELNFDPFFTPLQSLMLKQGLYGITPNKKRCLELLDSFGLKGKEHAYIRSLSGGMKRRVLIAGALVHSPQVVILDEPTAGVDLELRKNIWSELQRINQQGTTIILTTHYLEEAENLCNNIAIINKGKVVAHDNTQNLLKNLGNHILRVGVSNPNAPIPESLKPFLGHIDPKSNKHWCFAFKNDEDTGFILNELFKHNIFISDIKTYSSNLEDVFTHLINH